MSQKQSDKKASRDDFRGCMKLLAGGFRVTFDEAAMKAYWIAVGDLEPAKMRAAFERAIREETGHFPPSPGKIRACAVPARMHLPPERPFTPPTEAQRAEMHLEIQALRRRIAENLAGEARAAADFMQRWTV